MDIVHPHELQVFHNHIKKTLGTGYLVVSTPTDLTQINGNDVILKIGCKDYTMEEIDKAIGLLEGRR